MEARPPARPARRFRPGARWGLVVAVTLVVVAVVLIVLISRKSSATGYDVSYPQCARSYPSDPLFGIVGLNGGRASNTNRCLGREVQWALRTPGQKRPKQPSLSLYIDAGNPGGHHVPDWPTSGTSPGYGACNGLLTNACSYLYGEQRATSSYHLASVLVSVAAETVPWWLDVELTESWAGTYQLNIAALRGFIAGLTAETTATFFNGPLPDWVAGTAATLDQARKACTSGGFTGVAPTLAQYRAGPFDADLRCSDTATQSQR